MYGGRASPQWEPIQSKDWIRGIPVSSGPHLPATIDVPGERERDLLLVFKGAIHRAPADHPSVARRTLRGMHNGIDTIVQVYCAHSSRECGSGQLREFHTRYDPECAELDRQAWANQSQSTSFIGKGTQPSEVGSDSIADFDGLLHRASFAAVVPGEGTHSYRLLESLQAGAIPVIIGFSATPFPDLLRWDRIGVVQRDASQVGLLELMERLRTMPLRFRDALRDAGQAAYMRYLSSLARHVDGLFETLRVRYHRVLRRGGGEVPGSWSLTAQEDLEAYGFYAAERLLGPKSESLVGDNTHSALL